MEDIQNAGQHQKQQNKDTPVKSLDQAQNQSTQKQVQTQSKHELKSKQQQKIQEHNVSPSQQVASTQNNQKEVSKSKQKQIQDYVAAHKIQLTQEQLKEFVEKQNELQASFQGARLQQWMKSNNLLNKVQAKKKKQQASQETHKGQLKESKKKEEKIKKQEKMPQISNGQLIQRFFQKNGVQQTKEMRVQIIKALNAEVNSKLEITDETLQVYLKNTENKTISHFKQWLVIYEQKQIEAWNNAFQQSVLAKQVETHLKKLQQIVSLADSTKSNLNINLGAGDGKGKTSLKMGILLKEAQKQKFTVKIQVKIKKKVQLRHFIQNQLKKASKADEFGVFKMSKIRFQESQKSLKVEIASKVFEDYVFKELIATLEQRFKQEKKPVLKAQVQVSVKNSIRQDESILQNKRFIKWIVQGFTKALKVQGNSKVAQHFTAPFAEYFPIFKVVKSGDVLLKLKQIQNVDKLFDKLGINEICEQTPTLQKYLQVMIKQHLDSNIVLWIGDILKYILLFACNIPNERISIETNINISHLLLYLSISSDACKQLGEIISKANIEQFS